MSKTHGTLLALCLALLAGCAPRDPLQACYHRARRDVARSLGGSFWRDPLSPKSDISRIKPNMTPLALPQPDPKARLTDIKVGAATLSLPMPEDMRTESREAFAWGTSPSLSFRIYESVLNSARFDLPPDVRRCVNESGPFLPERVQQEVARLNSMPRFDLLVAVLNVDASGLADSVPFPQRIANLLLYVTKASLAPDREDIAFQYVEDDHIRCIVMGPLDSWTESVGLSGGRAQRREYKEYQADFAFRGANRLYSLSYAVPRDVARAVTLDDVLAFLANCRLKEPRK